MDTYEIEIKTLLGVKENVDKLKIGLSANGFDMSKAKKSSQLNHYFTYSQLDKFKENILPLVAEDKKESFLRLITTGKDFSVRTRESNGRVLIVIKASLDEGTSSNGVSRMEFEETVPMTLTELDNFLLQAGLEYQAKWSREREEYTKDDLTVCIDKNAGYGYLAEFEKIVTKESDVAQAKTKLEDIITIYGLKELKQDRLARMFDFYNNNWADYYGTEKVFNIE